MLQNGEEDRHFFDKECGWRSRAEKGIKALLKPTWALSKSIVGGDVDGCQWLTPIFAEEVLQQLMLLTTVNEH